MSGFSEVRERLARLNPEQRALLTRRLAAGRDTSPSDVYLEMVPAVPLRTQIFGQPGESPRQIAVYPASHGQQRMWLLHEYSERLPVYVIPSSFHLVGPFDEELLMGAVADVVRRHDNLRATFVMEDGQLFQHVASGAEFAFEAKNFQAVPEGEREAAAKRFLEEVAGRSFDLAAAPGFRVVLARLGPEEHVLCLVLHHIISDGWSRSNLWRDLAACYTARAAGAGMPPQLPFQFVDYAAWQLRQLAGGTFEKQAEYWKAQLAGGLEPLELPSDRPRPAKESFRGARASLVLDNKLIERLTARAREEGATLFMVLLAAYKALLHRYTGSADPLIGVPVANRQRVEVEALVGFFVNTLVMRTDLSGDPTFRELLGRVKETAIQAYAHQDMPFDRLVEMLQIPRHAGVAPVFQAGFALQDFPEVSLELPDIRSTPWPVDTHTTKWDLHLAVEQTGDGWVATAEYSTDLFDADRVERMLGHWRVILENIANDPGQTLANIPLLTEHERHRLLVDWNKTERDYPQEKCVRQLFEEQAARTPDAVAVVCDGESLTITALFRAQAARTPQAPALESAGRSFSYAELDAWSDDLAQRFLAAGVRRGDLVGIRGVRRAETVAALLGILKAGAAYLPLNPSDPASRLRRILEDAAPVAVVEPEKGAHSATPFTGIVLDVCGFDDDCFPARSAGFTDVSVDDLAYVCYTSGSTGQPKGVMIPHRGVARLVRNTNYIDIRQDDVFLQLAPLSFDASTFEIWGALLNGAKLVVYGPENVELGDLGRSIRDNKISTLWLTSALFNLMVDGELESLLGVRHLLAGGDVLSVPHVKKLLERMPAGHVLINGYGPTENTTFTCCHRMDRDSVINARVPIGIPVTGTDVVMVDEKGRPAPRNAAGEILVGGAGLARGYLKSPALDAEKFVSLAIQGGERRRFYRTGDLGAWNSDGTLDFRGRMDEQMKIRGFRVEPGEIEAALRGLEGIRDAAVALDEGDSGERQIRAFVVRDDTHLGVAAIKAGLQSALPDYMVPAAVHFLDALPVTPNGKVDRAALREMAVRSQNGSTTDPGNAPRDLLEHRLTAIWCRLFGRKDIGRDANFFELGGHSLLAAQLAHEVEKLVGHRFPIARVFQAQTIAELAAMVEGEDWAPAWSSLVPLRAEGDKAPMFFVHGYGGDVYAFVHLVRAMEKGRPVYGLQAAESSGGIPPHETMEQMAAHYAREIRSLQPEGPYHLAGYSLGGWIAYAVAQELRQSGQEVALLVLFDTAATANVPWYFYGLTAVPDLAGRTLRHVRKLRQVPWSEIGDYLAGPLRTLRYLLSRSQREPETDYAKEMGWKADPWNLLHARYRPAPYGGKMIVFLASARADGAARPDSRIASRSIHALKEKGSRLFWKRMARGGVRFHRVPGTHHTILSTLNAPHVAREIDDALTGQPPSPSLVAAGEGGGATLVHWFEEQVAKTPSAPAVQFGETCLTYRELDERVRRLASLFSAQGAGRGEYVAVLLERSIDLLPTLFAIIRCGAAYVPLDPKLPEVRRRMILEEVQPVLVATQSRFVSLLAGDPFARVCVDDIGEDDPVAELPVRPSPQDAVYVIYTSGSTGRPKGVVVRHDSLSNLLHSIRKRVSFGGKEIFVSATAITWDGCLLELFLPLVCGAKLVLASEAQRVDPAALINLVEESAATFFKATPTMWQMLVEFGWRGSPRLTALSGGEALSSDLVEALLPRTRALWNGYGPTETTGWSLACHIKGGDKISIGTPIDNTRIYVVDANGRLCAPGEKGELWIGGLGVASGYLNQPELTAERFIPDPFVGVPGERVFRTGDIVSLGTDGNVSFHGRADHQVKIRGHRIELGEIEQTLSRHPDAAHCAVTTRDGHAGLELAVYLVPRAGAELSSTRLKQWLGRHLPDYMIPARFFILDALPLTAGGKTDRKALAQADCREVPIGGERAAPRYDLEKELCAIWKTILEREQIGIHDNFFDLGGNSLLVAACCASVGRETGLEVPVRLLFDNPTIAGLAAELGLSQDKLEPIVAADRGNALPASFGQESIWFERQVLPDAAAYNEPVAWRFAGPVDAARLRASLGELMKRHEILRTALVYEGGRLRQHVYPPEEVDLPWRTAVCGRECGSDEIMREDARRSFDLARAPLWRALWIETAPGEHALQLTFHHSISDEWSVRLLASEIQKLYAGETLDPLVLQYADYAAWQRREHVGQGLENLHSYWRRQLSDLPAPVVIPPDLDPPVRSTGRGAVESFHLPVAVAAKFKSLAQKEGTTVFVVMLAAFQLWLRHRSGQNDILVGTPFAQRNRPETQSMTGYFLNMIPIRTKFEEGESFRALIRRVRETILGAFKHTGLPFSSIVDLAASQRESGARALFRTMFVLLEQGVPSIRLGEISSHGEYLYNTGTAKCDLTLFIDAEHEEWDCRLEYSTDLFTAQCAAEMCEEMTRLFGALTEDPLRAVP